MKITYRTLERKGCCAESVIWFKRKFPEGINLNKKGILKFCKTIERCRISYYGEPLWNRYDRYNFLLSLFNSCTIFICSDFFKFWNGEAYWYYPDVDFEKVGISFWEYYKTYIKGK